MKKKTVLDSTHSSPGAISRNEGDTTGVNISPGNRQEMLYSPDQRSNRNIGAQRVAMCWLWYWSLSTPNSLCVNHKHKTCTLSWERKKKQASRLRKAPLLTLSPAFSACAVPPDKNKRVLCRSSSFNAHPPPSCDGIPVPWHNPGCAHETRALHAHACLHMCVRVRPLLADADSTAERPTSSTEVCWHAPTWQRGLFF